jgi:hypothetical protein
VWPIDDGGLGDRVMGQKNGLYLDWIEFYPGIVDHVIGAAFQ